MEITNMEKRVRSLTCFLLRWSKYIGVQIILEWLTAEDIIYLDVAVMNRSTNDSFILRSWLSEYSKLFSLRLFGNDVKFQLSCELLNWCSIIGLNCSNAM